MRGHLEYSNSEERAQFSDSSILWDREILLFFQCAEPICPLFFYVTPLLVWIVPFMRYPRSSASSLLPVAGAAHGVLQRIGEQALEEAVRAVSIPRHFTRERANNRRVAEWLEQQLQASGWVTSWQGHSENLLAMPEGVERPSVLIGAHYDSVPNCPGADDNGSAVAAALICAQTVQKVAASHRIGFVFFNREEDGLIGSREFVHGWLLRHRDRPKEVHILEMVGYCSHQPGSQRAPRGLPVRLPKTGNFLGLLGNRDSNHLLDLVLAQAKGALPSFPVVGLKVALGLERHLPVLNRSDHAPFWEAKVPAIMWTDTSEFRNPNYHKITDTPETLSYPFLRAVTALLTVRALAAGR